MPGPLEMIEAVRAHHSACERGDLDAALAVLSEDVRLDWVGAGAVSGTHHGRAGVREAMGEWERDPIRIRVDQVVVTGATLVARCVHQARGGSSGVEVDVPATQVWTFGEDGLARRLVTGPVASVPVSLPAHVEALLDRAGPTTRRTTTSATVRPSRPCRSPARRRFCTASSACC